MPRYSLKDLLLSTALVAVGMAMLYVLFTYRWGVPNAVPLMTTVWIAGGTLIWAGLLLPFRHPWIGACVGAVIQMALIYAFLVSSRVIR